MKKKLYITGAIVFLLMLFFFSCQKQAPLKTLVPHLPAVPFTYYGSSYYGTDNTPGDNQMTDDGATLGRLLFYDPRLSLNNTVSCATCHQQENGFADVTNKSTGYEGLITKRNTPPIINEFSKASFFWDGRAASLEEMVLMPIQNHLEMGMDKLDAMERKIGSVAYYAPLFQKAFGSEEVTHNRIAKALAQFVRSIRSENSPADNSYFDSTSNAGLAAFMKFKCDGCHRGANFGGDPLFITYYGTSPRPNSANIGLEVDYSDKGIKEITGNDSSTGAFIIPSLRNLQFTAPYMHDGRYKTLKEVIEHYNSGIQPSAELDHILIDPATARPVVMAMTPHEKAALESFLLSLSDASVTEDVRFSNPFK